MRHHATLAVVLIVAATRPGFGHTDLIPPLSSSSSQITFYNTDNSVNPARPNVPGPPSPWGVAQFNHDDYLTPRGVKTYGSGSSAVYAEISPDQESELIIRGNGGSGRVFSLYDADGTVTSDGGRSLYLVAPVTGDVDAHFDREIDLSEDARVYWADVGYATDTAERTGAVLGFAYSTIGLYFHDPAGLDADQFVFMQVGLTFSSDRYTTSVATYACNAGGIPIIYSPALSPGQRLPFRSSNGPFTHLTYNLTAFLRSMVNASHPCGGTGASVWDQAHRTLTNWRVSGFNWGSETENTDGRATASTSQPQGHVQLGISMANVTVVGR